MKLNLILSVSLFFSLNSYAATQAKDPVLTLQSESSSVSFKRSDLLKRKDLEKITIENDPAYPGKVRHYTAISIVKLFKTFPLAENASLRFECLDGFSAPIDKTRLFTDEKGKAKAYLAIEKPNETWPMIGHLGGGRTAGPFYLVWTNPKTLNISKEEWPFQLSGFKVQAQSFAEQFPHVVPGKEIGEKDSVRRGFNSFSKNCFACHTLNLEGMAKLGPDLNVPSNPTEYLKEDYFRKLVRDPQSLRHWPESKMSGFNEEAISNDELTDIISYLKYMASHKVK